MKIPLLLRTDEEWDGVEGAGVGVGALEPPVLLFANNGGGIGL